MSTEIPVFDISAPSEALADDIVAAMGKYGFLFIKSSGIGFSGEDVRNVFGLSKAFFASPRTEKNACPMQQNNRGYTSMGSETLDPATQKSGDPKEAFNFGEFVDGKAQQPLPTAFQDHEGELGRFSSHCYGLCLKLLDLIAMGLKIEDSSNNGNGGGGSGSPIIDKSWFSRRHDPRKGDSGTILRLLHYPASHGEAAIRAGAHSDYGSMTLLFRLPGQPGLEILTPENEWASVPVTPPGTEHDPFPPILVNIGDLLSYWTSGLLKSTVHRVVGNSTRASTTEDRYSIAFFCHPCRDTALVPVPSVMVRDRIAAMAANGASGNGQQPVGYGSGANEAAAVAASKGSQSATATTAPAANSKKVLTADEHLYSRLAATYGWEERPLVS